MTERPSIDSHRLWQRGPLLIFENHGDFRLAQVQQVTAACDEILAAEGLLLLLLDFSDLGQLELSTRRHLAQWAKDRVEHLCIAAVDGSTLFRTTLTLVLGAVRVLTGRSIPAQSCRDRVEALAWLNDRHIEYQRQQMAKRMFPVF